MMGHIMTKNKNGFIVEAKVTMERTSQEWEATLAMIDSQRAFWLDEKCGWNTKTISQRTRKGELHIRDECGAFNVVTLVNCSE